VLIDCMSRYVELFPTRTVSAEECAEKLLEFYGRNGAPEELLSDNHSLAAIFESFWRKNVYYPH